MSISTKVMPINYYISISYILQIQILVESLSILRDATLLRRIDYTEICLDIKSVTKADVYDKWSPNYNVTRMTENDLCNSILPDLIVVPKSTKDVSSIVKISRKYKVPLSVRSGGHSYICASIKPYGIHIDMRRLNKVQLTTRYPFHPPGPAVRLGPGHTC